MLDNPDKKKKILHAMGIADMEIEDISVTIEKLSIDDLPSDMPDAFKNLIIDPETKVYESKNIRSIHKGVDFDFNREESEGTKRFFAIIGSWIKALENGQVIVVDELDTKLHVKLIEYLVRLFHNEEINPKNAQLIFTTHNTNLLDIQKLLRRDQVWFTEKNEKTGSSSLFSLVEFHEKNEGNIQKRYLDGRYGALPFIDDTQVL